MEFFINKESTLPVLKMEQFSRICPTIGCNRVISYKRKDVYKFAIKKNTLCSKCAKKIRKSVYNKYLDKSIINKILSIYYDKEKTLKIIANECGIKFDTLSKIIKLKNLPKIKRIGKIIDRGESYQKMFKTKFGLSYDEYLLTKPEFYRYKGRVKYYTNKTIKKFKNYIPNLDKVGKGPNDYHIDHMVSIKDCYIANIEPYIVADIINLRSIPRNDNLSKGPKSLFSTEILSNNVTERNNNKIKINDLYGIFYK
jgi:hypothetical protein